MIRAALISDSGEYRHWLTRQWGDSGVVCWVMLNPSTADGETDDPTLRKCIGFSRTWGFGGLIVVNAYALRATDPRELKRHPDPVGYVNDTFVTAMATEASLVVVGWGANISDDREREVSKLLERFDPQCLGITKDGHPRHPLYVPYAAELQPWRRT